MNSADAWHESNDQNLEALLGLSVETIQAMKKAEREIEMEAAKERHPSGADVETVVPDTVSLPNVLTALDRCDAGCGAAALYRVSAGLNVLDYCHHHHNRLFPNMPGWVVTGENSDLYAELYNSNRLQGGDHA
jgi:hypothetical protein